MDMHKPGIGPDADVTHEYGTVFVAMTDPTDSIIAAGTMDGVVLGGSTIRAKTITDIDTECVLRSAPEGLLKKEGGKILMVKKKKCVVM